LAHICWLQGSRCHLVWIKDSAQATLGGHPAPLPKIFGQCLLWPNGGMDQDRSWHGGRPHPGDFMLDRDLAPPPPKGGRAPCPIFGPFLLWPNGCMHQDATWYRGRPHPRGLCVRWGPSPSPKNSPIFGPCLLRPNGCMDQDATWYGGRPQPRRLCIRWGPSSPPQKGGRSHLPKFRPMSSVAKGLDGSKWHLAWGWALVITTLC